MDRYLVKVSGKAWHTGCLKCCMCGLELGKEATCYTKEDKIYCKTDYARLAFVCLLACSSTSYFVCVCASLHEQNFTYFVGISLVCVFLLDTLNKLCRTIFQRGE